MEYEAIKTYEFKWDRNLKIVDDPLSRLDKKLDRASMYDDDDVNDVDAAGLEVDRRAKQYMEEYVEDDYGKALHKVLAVNPDLKSRYADMPEPTVQRNFAQAEVEDAGLVVDTRAKEYVTEHRVSYAEAVDSILASDVRLAERYGAIGW